MKKLIFAVMALAMLAMVSCEEEEYGYAPVYKSITCLTDNPKVGDTCILQLTVKNPGNKYYRAELTWTGNGGTFLMPDMPKDLCKEILIKKESGKPSAKIKYVDPEKYLPTVKWVPSQAGKFDFTISGQVSLSLANEEGALIEGVPGQGQSAIKGSVTVSAAD